MGTKNDEDQESVVYGNQIWSVSMDWSIGTESVWTGVWESVYVWKLRFLQEDL